MDAVAIEREMGFVSRGRTPALANTSRQRGKRRFSSEIRHVADHPKLRWLRIFMEL